MNRQETEQKQGVMYCNIACCCQCRYAMNCQSGTQAPTLFKPLFTFKFVWTAPSKWGVKAALEAPETEHASPAHDGIPTLNTQAGVGPRAIVSPHHNKRAHKQKFAFSLGLLLQVEIVWLKNRVCSLLRSRQCTDDNPSRGYCEATSLWSQREEEESCRIVLRSAVRAL